MVGPDEGMSMTLETVRWRERTSISDWPLRSGSKTLGQCFRPLFRLRIQTRTVGMIMEEDVRADLSGHVPPWRYPILERINIGTLVTMTHAR